MKLRLVGYKIEAARAVYGGGGLKVLARLCRRHSGGECLLPRPGVPADVCSLQLSRHEAPTGEA